MRAGLLALAILMVGAWHGPASAQAAIEERLGQRSRHLAERVPAQDPTIVEKDRQVSRLTGLEDGWFDNVSVAGAVGIEAAFEEDFDGKTSNGFETATVDVAVEAEIDGWVGATAALAMSDGAGIEVDEAFVTLAPADTAVSIRFGRQRLPFGVYESELISDALAKELGDTGQDAAVLGVKLGGVGASGFLFNGDLDRKGGDTAGVRNAGFALDYLIETGDVSIGVGVSYINDIGESDLAEEAIAGTAGSGMVPGGATSVIGRFGGMTVIAEYVTALEDFGADELAHEGDGARPAAWGVEASYGREMYGRDVSAAIAWHRSIEAQALGLPESRFLVGFSIGFADGVGLTLEYRRDNDYGTGAGGTGNAANAATMRLAAEF